MRTTGLCISTRDKSIVYIGIYILASMHPSLNHCWADTVWDELFRIRFFRWASLGKKWSFRPQEPLAHSLANNWVVFCLLHFPLGFLYFLGGATFPSLFSKAPRRRRRKNRKNKSLSVCGIECAKIVRNFYWIIFVFPYPGGEDRNNKITDIASHFFSLIWPIL